MMLKVLVVGSKVWIQKNLGCATRAYQGHRMVLSEGLQFCSFQWAFCVDTILRR